MADFYQRLTENLGKLQRNESQMTEEQKKQYAAPLKKLKEQIAQDTTEAMKAFVTMGMRLAKDDEGSEDLEQVYKEVDRISQEHTAAGTIKKASRILFTTYNLDKFFESLCMMHYDIWYKAYGPYWLKHCTKQEDPEYPYHNDIIDMDWWAEHHEWAKTKIENGKRVTDYYGGVTIMIPPTQELLDKEYAAEKERMTS